MNAYDWVNDVNEQNRKKYGNGRKVENGVKKVAKGFDYAARPVQPAFVGNWVAQLFKNAADAANVTGFNIDSDNAERVGGSVGAVAGTASAISPKANTIVNPLMQAAMADSLLQQYGVTRHLADAAETVDPLGINRKMDDIPFWDRAFLAITDPEMLVDFSNAVRDLPGPHNILQLFPTLADADKYSAAKSISTISKFRDRMYPQLDLGYVEPQDLYGWEFVPEDKEEIQRDNELMAKGIKVKPTPYMGKLEAKGTGLNATPYKDWLWETGKAMFDPREWKNAAKAWTKTVYDDQVYHSLWDD